MKTKNIIIHFIAGALILGGGLWGVYNMFMFFAKGGNMNWWFIAPFAIGYIIALINTLNIQKENRERMGRWWK